MVFKLKKEFTLNTINLPKPMNDINTIATLFYFTLKLLD